MGRSISNFLRCASAVTVLTAHIIPACAGTYDYAGKHLYTGQRSNNWNSAASWTNGPAAFPNAPGDIARTVSFVNGDVDLYLNQDITVGTFNWRGLVLCVYGGTPAGKLIVDNAGQPSSWQMEITGWLRWYTDLVLSNELTLIITNSTGFGERAVPSVLIGGVISGPGKLVLDVRSPRLNACELGINWQARNTHMGGTRLVATPSGRIYFAAMKQGSFGNGNVELAPFTKLVLRNLFQINDYIADTAALCLETADVTNRAHLQLAAGVNEKVASLYIDGVQMPAGIYGSPESGAPEQLADFFGGAGTLTVLTGPPNPGKIRNLPAISTNWPEFLLGGELIATNAAPTTVYLYWGLKEGGMKPEAWENEISVGERGLGQFYVPINGYTQNQTIFYTCYLSNALGGKWAGSTAKLCPPAVQNEPPLVRSNYVTLRGSVLSTGGPPTVLTAYWGRTDGSTNAAAWENATVLGVSAGGMLASNAAGLQPDTVYYYRVRGVNPAGESWADKSQVFKTVAEPTWGEITFAVASDLHYGAVGHVPSSDELCRQTIENINSLPGTPYPQHIGGGFVGPLRGVLLVGDLTDTRSDQQWSAFTNDWGLAGDQLLAFPVYEAFGNHDAGSPYGIIPQSIKARNARRPRLQNISPNGYHYSFDWDFLHVVCLNVFPGNELDPGYGSPHPSNSLQFLQEDLAKFVGPSGRPVVIYHHYGFDGTGQASWSERQRTNFYEVIKNYNVVCIFNGHSHAVSSFPWRGITTCIVGTAGKYDGNYVLARLTRTNLVLMERTISNTWGRTFTKNIYVPPYIMVANDEDAVETSFTSAKLSGRFLMNGPPPVYVSIFWGRTDGGTNQADWENAVHLGELQLGPFSTVVTGLLQGATYYYRCFASNKTEQAWAPTSTQFRTLAPNTAPVLEPVPDKFVEAGEMLLITNIATDAESPPQILTFRLLSGPPGSFLAPDTGVFGWRAPPSRIGSTNQVVIAVTDNGYLPLGATQSFNIIVLPPTRPLISDITVTNGYLAMKIWGGLAAEHMIEYSTNLRNWTVLLTTNGPVLPFYWCDSNQPMHPAGFYRVRCGH